MNNILNINPNQVHLDALEPAVLPTFAVAPLQFTAGDKWSGTETDVTDTYRRVIYNVDTQQVVNVVKNSYNFNDMQYVDNLKVVENILLASGIDLTGVSRTVDTSHNGGRMVAVYTMPAYLFDVGNGDEIQFQIVKSDSRDGSWCFSVQAGGVRIACINRMLSTQPIALYKSKHTFSLNPDHARRKMVTALQAFQVEGEKWKRWRQLSITNRQAFAVFAKAAGCKFVASHPELTIYELLEERGVSTNKALSYMWNQYTRFEQRALGSNEWAVFNALTHWSTHAPAAKKTAQPNILDVKVRRQGAVREAAITLLAA